MKYKVGDKVRVRRDLVVDKRYGGINCLQVHKKEGGKIFTIGAIEDCDYQLNNNLYWWSEEMLEEVDEMKYKVGDKVRVRKDLEAGSSYGEDSFAPDMKKYLGKTMTISSIVKNCKYRLKEDTGHWNWTDEMLEDVEDITILVKNNKVIAKMGDKVGIAKCSPEDEFDIFTGARLAIDRLEEKCNPYSWLEYGDRYYVPSFIDDDFSVSYIYRDDPTDIKLKERGLVFKTEEEAINCAKKMLGK